MAFTTIVAGMGEEQRAGFMEDLTEDDTSWEEQWERVSAQLGGQR